MARRTYSGQSYSPLNEVTAANVKDLRLAWVWNMNEGGANQAMPLVHNGVMYLWNTGNVIQALDAKTGDLIWENEVGPLEHIGFDLFGSVHFLGGVAPGHLVGQGLHGRFFSWNLCIHCGCID